MQLLSHVKWLSCIALLFLSISQLSAAELFVASAGNDNNPGTQEQPLASLAGARDYIRKSGQAGKEPFTVTIADGVYYLPETVVFTEADSGTLAASIVYRAANEGKTVISGGTQLSLSWTAHQNGILKAKTPAGLAIDQLFVNGQRQHMARYPNFDLNARPYNGAAADAFSPERAARWKDPTGGYIHAMHSGHWGGFHYRITGKNEKNEVAYEGGWQNNRPSAMHKSDRFVENIFEELDAPGEWFHDAKQAVLYYYPAEKVDTNTALFEVVRLRHLIEFQGTQQNPVRHISLSGFTFRHAARTFMETKEPLLRSDWTIYRGGAVLITGAEDCAIIDSEFDQLGGNSIFVNNYNRRIAIRGCHIHGSGASGICFVGNPDAVRNPLMNYNQRQSYNEIDLTPGPKTDNYPGDCVVDDCLIHNVSVVEKQATGVQLSMAQGITIRHCSIYDVGRAGINISEGTFGGHTIEYCDVFDTVRETGDHGSFNSWGRDRFWGLKEAPAEKLSQLALLDVEKNTIRNSRWRCDHGWDVDLDDGSSNYEIYNNVFLNGGLKLREGFHRKVYNNIAINNSMHLHVWYESSMDEITRNIFMTQYRPIRMPAKQWGKLMDRNLFLTEEAKNRYAEHGCDLNSLAGDPLFIDPEHGDYRVKEGSPALKLGFVNFPMDQFGVKKSSLKAISRTPKLPILNDPSKPTVTKTPASPKELSVWQGATVAQLAGEDFSAFGVSKEAGGVHLVSVPDGTFAAIGLFNKGDVIQAVGGAPIKTVSELTQATNKASGKPLEIKFVRGQKSASVTMVRYVYANYETSAGDFNSVKLLPKEKILSIQSVSVRPRTLNEPVAVLSDGKLAQDYGPVFGNNVSVGVYRIDLGKETSITEIRSWSFNQGSNRGSQRFTLFGVRETVSPKRVPLVMVDTRKSASKTFVGSKIQTSDGKPIGTFRWLEWTVQPVTAGQENTAYQEFQIIGASE
ncbi:MAG: signaling protein [Blastopirellula sp.]|nr:MAG: signaling protein [Blastopirellula sp.]